MYRRALGGEYVLPEAGGDLLRDGAGVLPTGRNIHALDPYRMPRCVKWGGVLGSLVYTLELSCPGHGGGLARGG